MEKQLSLWLDYYDDIYSDFDSRKYHKRRLSEDFVDELKASVKHKIGEFDKLLLLLPPEQRNEQVEKEIITSLKERFQELLAIYQQKERKIFRKGILLLLSGVLIMAINSLLIYKGYKGYIIAVLSIIMEPASWFLVWNGLDSLVYDYRVAKNETGFYKVIGDMEICFKDIWGMK